MCPPSVVPSTSSTSFMFDLPIGPSNVQSHEPAKPGSGSPPSSISEAAGPVVATGASNHSGCGTSGSFAAESRSVTWSAGSTMHSRYCEDSS